MYKLLFPDVCCLCNNNGLEGLDLCSRCHATLPHNHNCCMQCAAPLHNTTITSPVCGQCLSCPGDIDRAIIPYLYRPPVDYMIRRLKFSQDVKYSRLIGELLADAVLQQTDILPNILIPVPVHHHRLVSRGFNQAEMIARTTSRRLRIAVNKEVVTRTTAQLPQTSLSASERETNIRRAFSIRDASEISDLDVAVVDDVYTTGATARAITRQLRRAGAKTVSIWAVARTP